MQPLIILKEVLQKKII